MQGEVVRKALHTGLCRYQALHPRAVLGVSCGLGVRCLVVTGCVGTARVGCPVVKPAMDVLMFDWARISIWAMTEEDEEKEEEAGLHKIWESVVSCCVSLVVVHN